MCRHPPKLTRTDQLFPYAPHFRSQSAVIAADRASRARSWILPAAPTSPSSTSVRWPTPRSRQNRATISASAALSGLKPWSTVRARTRPGKAACASSSRATRAGPPDTATASFPSPIAPFSASTASRKRWAASGGALSRDTRLRRLILEGRAHLRAIDVGQLAIDLAGLLRLVELHQRLPQPIKAVGSAIPPGVVLIRSEEHTSE